MIKKMYISYLEFQNFAQTRPPVASRGATTGSEYYDIYEFKNHLNRHYYNPLGLNVITIYHSENRAGLDLVVEGFPELKRTNFKWGRK